MIERDEGDDADGVLIKLYSEETNGAISIIEQAFERAFCYHHMFIRTMSGSTFSRERCMRGSGTRLSGQRPDAG